MFFWEISLQAAELRGPELGSMHVVVVVVVSKHMPYAGFVLRWPQFSEASTHGVGLGA